MWTDSTLVLQLLELKQSFLIRSSSNVSEAGECSAALFVTLRLPRREVLLILFHLYVGVPECHAKSVVVAKPTSHRLPAAR